MHELNTYELQYFKMIAYFDRKLKDSSREKMGVVAENRWTLYGVKIVFILNIFINIITALKKQALTF